MRFLPLFLLLPLGCSGDTSKDTAPVDTGGDTDTDTGGDTDTDTGGDTDTDTGGDTDTGTPPADADRDGYTADVDCDDGDPAVNPGAVELCNGLNDDCDAATGEAGTASFRDASGAWLDATAALSGGTPDNPTVIGDAATDDISLTAGTVYVCAGTWNTKVVFAEPGSDVTLVAPAGAGATTLTTEGTAGGAVGSVVAVTNATLTLQGFTISGGTGSVETSTQGGGVIVNQTLGGTLPATPNLTLLDSVVTDNAAEYGGGVAVRGVGWLAIEDSEVRGNTGEVAGGGVWVQNYGQVSCAASRLGAAGITDNTSAVGGGVYLSSADGGTVDAVGCDWGSGGDDNATYDLAQNPAASKFYCYGNATALTDTVTCDGATCTASTVSCP